LLYYTVWATVDTWNSGFLRMDTYYVVTPITVVTYFMASEDHKGLAILAKWAVIFMGVTAVMSIYSSFKDPTYARAITAGELDPSQLDYFKKFGGGTYSFAEALIYLFPMMAYFYRNNEKSIFSKKLILLYGVICFYALLRIQIFADILFASFMLIISLLGGKRMRMSISLIAVLVITIFLIPNSLYSEFATKMSGYFNPTSVVYSKLQDLSTYLAGGSYYQTQIGYREARYPLLLSAFMKSPIVGYYYSNNSVEGVLNGGHLYWMNRLAVFGILGFLLYMKIHVDHLKSMMKSLDKEFSFYFLVAVAGGLGLGLTKNLDGREFWYTYFVVLPGLQYLPLLKKGKSEGWEVYPNRSEVGVTNEE